MFLEFHKFKKGYKAIHVMPGTYLPYRKWYIKSRRISKETIVTPRLIKPNSDPSTSTIPEHVGREQGL